MDQAPIVAESLNPGDVVMVRGSSCEYGARCAMEIVTIVNERPQVIHLPNAGRERMAQAFVMAGR